MPSWWTDIDKCWTLFLDRDGVINRRLPDAYVRKPEEFEWLPGAPQAIARLNRLFGLTIVVTNQQGIGKGLMSEEDLQRVHEHLLKELTGVGGYIDAIYHCPDLASHTPNCRKPSPAMALKAQRNFPQIDFQKSVIIGDSISDMEFGKRLGMHSVLVKGKQEEALKREKVKTDLTCADLAEFAAYIKS